MSGGPTNGWDALVALIVALPGIAAAVLAYLNRRAIRTPSGDRIGAVVERTHDMSAITCAHVTKAAQRNGGARRET